MLEFVKECWQKDKDRRILWLPVLFGLGIALYFYCPQEPSKWATLGVIETLIISAVLFRHYPQILRLLGLVACLVAGFTCVQVKSIWLAQDMPDLPSETFYFKGKVAKIDTNYQGRLRLILKDIADFDDNIYKGMYRVTQRSKTAVPAIGDCVEMVGTISKLPTEVVVGGYQFDRKGYFEGLKGTGYAESRWFRVECETPEKFSLQKEIFAVRQAIVKRINRVLPKSEAAIAAAIIAGEKGAVDEDLYTRYRNSGLAHFLSISGLHMTMIVGLMFFIVRLFCALIPAIALRYDSKKIAAVFAFGVSLAYLLISGMAVPALRAFVMTTIVLMAVITDRRAISMYSVALAALLILFISPEVLISASFQMSFAAVVGLIVFYEKTAARVQKWFKDSRLRMGLKYILIYVFGVIISDFIASIMTLPFSIYHFNMIALYTTLGNLLAGPVIGFVIMPMVLLSLLLMPFGLESLTLKGAGAGIELLNQITDYVSSLPNAGFKVVSMPHWGLMLITVGGLWLCLWKSGWRRFGIIGIIAGMATLCMTKVPDVLVAPEAKAIAFKNKSGELEIVSGHTGRFAKEIWKNKYPISKNKTTLTAHPEMTITENRLIVGDYTCDLSREIGLSIWYNAAGKPQVKTIRNDIGDRFWNK